MLAIYEMETCPYCHKVMDYADAHNIDYERHDVAIAKNANELMELGGKGQVPFLVDPEKGVRMYESDDIIEYLKENYV
jgi:glutathione S-transferase